jgi:hypothetical protein
MRSTLWYFVFIITMFVAFLLAGSIAPQRPHEPQSYLLLDPCALVTTQEGSECL